MSEFSVRPRLRKANIRELQRYIAQDPEIWFVLSTNMDVYFSEGNNFTPINPRGTVITWDGLEGVIGGVNQPGSTPQPQHNRNVGSLDSQDAPQVPLNRFPRFATPSHSQNQVTDITGACSKISLESDLPEPDLPEPDLLESDLPEPDFPEPDLPETPSRGYLDETRICSDDIESSQPTLTPRPPRYRNIDSLVSQRFRPVSAAHFSTRATPSQFQNRATDLAGASSRNLLETAVPETDLPETGLPETDLRETASRASADELRTCSTDSTPNASPTISARYNHPIYIPRSRPRTAQPDTLSQTPTQSVGLISAMSPRTNESHAIDTSPLPPPVIIYETISTAKPRKKPSVPKSSPKKPPKKTPSKPVGPSSSKRPSTTAPARKRSSAANSTCQHCGRVGHTKRSCKDIWCSYCDSDLHRQSSCPLAKAAAIVAADAEAARSLKREMEKDEGEEESEEQGPEKGKKRLKKN